MRAEQTVRRAAIAAAFVAWPVLAHAEDTAQNNHTQSLVDELQDDMFTQSDARGRISEQACSLRYQLLSKLSRYIIKRAKPEDGQ